MAQLGSLFPEELKPAQQRGAKNARGGKAGPAEHTFIKDLVAGQEIDGVFLVADASLRAAKNGSKYVQAVFADRTGTIPVRHWDANDVVFQAYQARSFAKARGRVETYQSKLQMVVFEVQRADEKTVNAGDYVPVSKRPREEMEKEFDELLETFTDPDYKRMLKALFADKEVREKFFVSPAANMLHHAWIGGLAEHVLSACKTAAHVADERPFLNRDLLVAGVILHDIGKILELDSGPGFNYTDTGRLIGHIVLGALLVQRFILEFKDFPPKKRDLILHLILSHHGTREFGSPVTPCTAEAVALHHLECMDAKVQGLQSLIEQDTESGNTGAWTDFSRMADGRVYKESKP
ncbi:MAG: HD domain-containing protein [Planctomycetota bacterium]|nr:HD domain-containing protein [Planctomycetota bacterium]